MIKRKKVSLIFPAFNEAKNIRKAILDFQKIKEIDEIIVIDNNSSDKTAILARESGARVITEKKQGYGYALLRGLKEAKGDYILLCEPDGTFDPKDAVSLLSHLDSYDVVLGTRTHLSYIGHDANMHGLLRLANITLAKIIQLLYGLPTSLTDCGCTYRVLKKSVVKKVLPNLHVGESHFLVDLLIRCIQSNVSIKEIPVHYQKRVGESKITGDFRKAAKVGVKMFQLAFFYRFNNR